MKTGQMMWPVISKDGIMKNIKFNALIFATSIAVMLLLSAQTQAMTAYFCPSELTLLQKVGKPTKW